MDDRAREIFQRAFDAIDRVDAMREQWAAERETETELQRCEREAMEVDAAATRAAAQREQQAPPPMIYKRYENSLQSAPQPRAASPDFASRAFVEEVFEIIAEESGAITGALAKRINKLETDNKQLREELDQAVSELTLLRAVTRGDVAQIGKRHVG